MKIGDLAYVNSTSTGDYPWVVDLYRTKYPVVFLGGVIDHEAIEWTKVFHNGEVKFIRQRRLKVIKT
jgi:hypothetical protein